MSRMMGYVEDVLFEMATVDSSTAEASHYIEAVREIRMKKREIQVRFENRFVSLFHDSIRRMKKNQLDSPEAIMMDENILSLVFDSGGESRSVLNTLDKARHECRVALTLLDRHVCTLFDSGEIKQFINPMQPDTVFGAFWESCRDIRSGADIRFILVEMFERYVVTDLQGVYDDLNKLFRFHGNTQTVGILPQTGQRGEKKGLSLVSNNGEILVKRESILVSNWVRDRLQQHIQGKEIPEFIEYYLLEYWRQVMQDIYEKHSDTTPEWDRALQVVDDLLTITCPNSDRDIKKQQIWMMPGLIYRLKNGMKSISLPLKVQADFLSELKAHHALITDFNFEGENSLLNH